MWRLLSPHLSGTAFLLSLDKTRSFAKLSLDTSTGKKINGDVNGAPLEVAQLPARATEGC